MEPTIHQETRRKLETQKVIWFGSVRADGRPHLAPVWFVLFEDRIYIGTDPRSVKVANIRRNPNVVLALEDGVHPVICEGLAAIPTPPIPEELYAAFFTKYEWNVKTDEQYHLIVAVEPRKWMTW